MKKLWIYLRPFCNWQFLISYFIPFMLINGWAWIGAFLLPIIGANWFTISATTWLGILWLPCTPEKLITIPIAIWIHTKLFGKKGKVHFQLMRMYAEAKKDWNNIKKTFRRIFMRNKPKSTTKNPKALLYRRYNNLEKSFSLSVLYKTTDNKWWRFDTETMTFIETILDDYSTITPFNIANNSIYNYKDKYFQYNNGWITPTPSTLSTKLGFNNIGNYQTNKYYYVCSFDYIRKGTEEGNTIQYIKGNIVPIENFDIQHYNDSVHLCPDDLIVINKRLYSVENPLVDRKLQPKAYKVYSATLNSIL